MEKEEEKKEEKNQENGVQKEKSKISLSKLVIISLILIILVVIIVTVIVKSHVEDDTICESPSNSSNAGGNVLLPTDINGLITEYKPIIYLYPEENTEVSVALGYPENITVSYPEYSDGWRVLASTDSTLIDLETERELYSLYYESTNKVSFEVTNEGYCVKSEDVAEFLEEKLEILGLSEREAEEFIIYWLPKLQENEYNYIRFATAEEIEENMPLTINPNPDTIIRVLMTYKGLEEPIEVEEQELETPERTGFVAVEWGGTEIN